ncbi:MAG: GNAT family N-acetyltransferase [Fibrobacterota bacterium]|nr:GNAT family N-acetyltransferase [Fibrobacterota bacterium]QQS03342.1 MAG: GNAT family N-acetyltransferase [Fibrobacterota bacterium]
MEIAPIDRIIACELLTHRTWPSRAQEHLGDWILRENEGFTRRANSCLALGDPGMALGYAVGRVEAWYRHRAVEPCIKVCEGVQEGLDTLLDERRWDFATPTRVLSIEALEAFTISPEFVIEESPSESWLLHLARWDGEAPEKAALHASLARRIPCAGFASWQREGEILAVAVAALEEDASHFYDLVVREDVRGQGIGRRFMESLLGWTRSQGASKAFLQVLDSNETAKRLYAHIGFVEHHRYHYRVAPGEAGPTCGC